MLNFGKTLGCNNGTLCHLWHIYLVLHPYPSALMRISQGSEGKACVSVGDIIVCIYGQRQGPQLIHWGSARASLEKMKTHMVPRTVLIQSPHSHATLHKQARWPLSSSLSDHREASTFYRNTRPFRSDSSASQKVISARHLEWPSVTQWQS